MLLEKFMINIQPTQISRALPYTNKRSLITPLAAALGSLLALGGCQSSEESFYGTLEPFASEAIYFAMTDRFVDGDKSNNYEQQGGDYPTYMRPLMGPDGKQAFVGYMGGDFKGILNNAQYIADMGFTAIWLTPIVDNPDQAFPGGEPIEFGGAFRDGGKTGYHGYWGVNFFELDEHLPSKDLDYKALTQQLADNYQIKTVLDVVANHGSPAFSMPEGIDGKFGKIFDQEGKLIADHQNLEPQALDQNNPLHQFFNQKPDIAQLADFNQDNPKVLDYLVEAYLQWIEQGAAALRIDTIKHMPHSFWKKFTDRIRAKHPEIFMFAESYSFEADFIGEHTQPENGGISVLDFPGREAMTKLFENPGSDFSELLGYLHLTNSPYANPYELTTFYDNHDMARMNADTNGFIDAHNWLFTSRGIPVVYYGSEMAFMAGTSEHAGNRNYFGQQRIEQAKQHPIHHALSRIANVRKNSIALQKGLQINLVFKGNQAAFYRVYEHEGVYQTALVLLNKGNEEHHFEIHDYLSAGTWTEQLTGETLTVDDMLNAKVDAHSVAVYILNQKNANELLRAKVRALMLEQSTHAQ
jgi:glycosidase